MVEIWKTFLPNFLEFTLVFYIFFLDFFEFLISDRTDPDEFQKLRPNRKQISILHYKNLHSKNCCTLIFPFV
jgi:hypothetical protein